MRILLLSPGTGHFYCGSCLRDNSLARALLALGHDVVVAPLYLPRVLEDGSANGERVLMGGVNMYLQQKAPGLFGRLPRFAARLLDRPGLLRWLSARGNMTDAADLGAMTLSMLRGEDGRQVRELDELVAWASGIDRPDVVVLSNIMLSGIVRRLVAALDCPVVATLQGEQPFLDALPGSYREDAWRTLRDRAADIDAFVAVSAEYGERVRARLGIEPDRVQVVHNGLELDDFAAEPEPLASRRPPAIGYLARMCRDKGVHTLVEAFGRIVERGRVPDARLRVAGAMLREDRALVAELRSRLASLGCADRVEFLPNLPRDEKLAFLRTLSVMSVPATYGESFGLYLLEAMAAGVPVVQPDHASFPELLAATGGGVLCAADDAGALAEAIEALLLDEPSAQQLADAGRRAVLGRFGAERMAREFAAVCERAVAARRGRAATPSGTSARRRDADPPGTRLSLHPGGS